VPIVKVNSQNRMKLVLDRASAPGMLIVVILFCSGVAAAQIPIQRPSPTPPPQPIDGTIKRPDDTPLTTFEEEMRAKRLIKLAEKDHQENLNRARDIAQLGKDLQNNLKDKSTLDRDALKKVDRLEKLTKKIRGEAGGEDEDVTIVNRPSDLPSALERVAQTTESLSKHVQNTPRQVVSASVINDANVLLELIRILRTYARQP
jgi:hypothetical protein